MDRPRPKVSALRRPGRRCFGVRAFQAEGAGERSEGMSVEGYLIEHCAPTLASLKTASLFSCPCRGQEDLQKELAECSRRLCPKGVELVLLRRCERSALVYVYRKGRLARELSSRPVAAFRPWEPPTGMGLPVTTPSWVSPLRVLYWSTIQPIT